jgi:hypothetical protein
MLRPTDIVFFGLYNLFCFQRQTNKVSTWYQRNRCLFGYDRHKRRLITKLGYKVYIVPIIFPVAQTKRVENLEVKTIK